MTGAKAGRGHSLAGTAVARQDIEILTFSVVGTANNNSGNS
jgi:hypothetical protein